MSGQKHITKDLYDAHVDAVRKIFAVKWDDLDQRARYQLVVEHIVKNRLEDMVPDDDPLAAERAELDRILQQKALERERRKNYNRRHNERMAEKQRRWRGDNTEARRHAVLSSLALNMGQR